MLISVGNLRLLSQAQYLLTFKKTFRIKFGTGPSLHPLGLYLKNHLKTTTFTHSIQHRT